MPEKKSDTSIRFKQTSCEILFCAFSTGSLTQLKPLGGVGCELVEVVMEVPEVGWGSGAAKCVRAEGSSS